MSMSHARGGNPDKRARQIRLFTATRSAVAELLGDDAKGLAPDAAPAFEGMHLNEVEALADAMAVSLDIEDGLADDENAGRGIWNESKWYVRAQKPTAGDALGRRRRVTVIVLKHDEITLSPYQSHKHGIDWR